MNMYRRVAFSLLLIVLSALSCFADEPTAQRSAANIAFRDSVVSFLKEEGFVPSVDEDGDIWFKKEGDTLLVSVQDDTAPFYVQINYGLSSEGMDDQVALLKAMNSINLNCRCIKCAMDDNGAVLISVETYNNTAQVFMDNFATYTDHLLLAGRLLVGAYDPDGSKK